MAERELAWPAAEPPAPTADITRSGSGETGREESFRARLRRETRPAHEKLDGSFSGLETGNRQDYAHFIQVSEACLRGIEPILAASALGKVREWRFEPRHDSALLDLSALAVPPLPVAPFPIARPSLPQALGIAYVLEGSRLGGRMILRWLQRAAPDEINPPLPTFFLETADRTDHFRTFLTVAEGLTPGALEQDAAIAAANATFGYFLDAARADRGRPINGAN